MIRLSTYRKSGISPSTKLKIVEGEDYAGSLNEEEGGEFGGRRGRVSGSYVEPGMEHLTTNLFVGNLDPTTTEEELTDAFRQFGKDSFLTS